MDETDKDLCSEAFVGLEARVRESLWRAGLHRFREVAVRDDDYLMALPGIDAISIGKVRRAQAIHEAQRRGPDG